MHKKEPVENGRERTVIILWAGANDKTKTARRDWVEKVVVVAVVDGSDGGDAVVYKPTRKKYK